MKKDNPFKFGTVVDEPYFTNRKTELSDIRDILDSGNHLIIISPRRFGKTSLVRKALQGFPSGIFQYHIQQREKIDVERHGHQNGKGI